MSRIPKLAVLFAALMGATAAHADTTVVTLTSAWQDVAANGSTVEVQVQSGGAEYTTSVGAPSAGGYGGSLLPPEKRVLSVVTGDLWMRGTGRVTVITGIGAGTSASSGSSTATATVTQTSVTLTAATSATLIAANSSRKSLRWMNTGTNPMTCVPGAGPAVAGTGMNYDPGSSANNQGGGSSFDGGPVPTNAFACISTGGTSVTVWEGN